MEAWRKVWRDGLSQVLPIQGLEALAEALRVDDPRLVQHATTLPNPFESVLGNQCEAGCAISFCAAASLGGIDGTTVGEVRDAFDRVCTETDLRLSDFDASAEFILWFDKTPRNVVRSELLPEVEAVLSARRTAA